MDKQIKYVDSPHPPKCMHTKSIVHRSRDVNIAIYLVVAITTPSPMGRAIHTYIHTYMAHLNPKTRGGKFEPTNIHLSISYWTIYTFGNSILF